MKPWLPLAGLVVAVAGLAAEGARVGQGQQPPAPARPQDPVQPPIFRTGTNLVRVDVTVTDRAGAPVRDLTADDFEVMEDDRPQSVTSFKLVEVNGTPTDDYSLPIRSVEHAAAEAARDDVRVFLIFWDEYHIGEFASAIRARDALTAFVLESFGPTDLVAIMDPLTTLDSIRFTRDRRSLADQVHRLRGRRGVYVPPRSVVEENQLRNRQGVERSRAEVTASALKAAITHLGTLREGRKSILLVSESLGPLGSDETRILSDLIRAAGHNNTAVYTFDPRGLQTARRFAGALESLAYGSGANPYVSNEMLIGLRRVVTQASAFYLLGYTPPESPMDGRFKRIKVRVKRDGLDVQARQGYWQIRAEDVTRARAEAAAAELPPEVSTAVQHLTPAKSHRPIDLWIGIGLEEAGARTIALAWAPRGGSDVLEVAASVEVEASMDGVAVYSGRLGTEGARFSTPPGQLQLTSIARNAAGDIIDREQRQMLVSSTGGAVLGWGTPAVYRVRSALDSRALDAGGAPIAATREFTRADRLRIRTPIYGTAAAGASVAAALLGRRAVKLVDLKVARTAEGCDIDLPLSAVAPGEYLVRIEAQSGDTRTATLLAFRVLR